MIGLTQNVPKPSLNRTTDHKLDTLEEPNYRCMDHIINSYYTLHAYVLVPWWSCDDHSMHD